MNRTIKKATVKRCHYDSHAQLKAHLQDLIDAYNYGRRLKTLRGLTPHEYICKIWATEPERFKLDPHHQMPGRNNQGKKYSIKIQPSYLLNLSALYQGLWS